MISKLDDFLIIAMFSGMIFTIIMTCLGFIWGNLFIASTCLSCTIGLITLVVIYALFTETPISDQDTTKIDVIQPYTEILGKSYVDKDC